MVGRTKNQNKADMHRMEIMSEIPCIPCMIDGRDGTLAQVQHCTDCGQRYEDQHQYTYKSCPWHHQGHVPASCKGSVVKAFLKYGPSFHHHKQQFAERYGRELELVRINDALVRIIESERRAGGYLTERELGNLTRDLHKEIVVGVTRQENRDQSYSS